MTHIPVLAQEVIEQFSYLASKKEPIFLDGTLGAGGHSIALVKKYPNVGKLIGIDQDDQALAIAGRNIAAAGSENKFVTVKNNFKNIDSILNGLGIDKIDGVLLDLGVSSMQFDDMKRGFSFKDPAQILDMRMDTENTKDAKFILNHYNEKSLEKILRDYGEERFAPRIAKEIASSRKEKEVKTVGDLLNILDRAIPKSTRRGKIHFATKTFQALRIEVNSELENLDKAIFSIVDRLNSGGRLAVITFHSLEDRIVKHAFLKLENPCECPKELPCVCNKITTAKVITGKPIVPSEEEIAENPRSRSAKLRVIEKL